MSNEALDSLKAQVAQAEAAVAAAKTDEEWRAAKTRELALMGKVLETMYTEARAIGKQRGMTDEEINEELPLKPDGTPDYD